MPPPRHLTALAGFLYALLAETGQTFVLALYVEPLMAALDVSRAAVSHRYTLATLSAPLLLVPVGRLADRWSPERFLMAVVIGIGLALVILSRGTAAWQVIAMFTVLRFCGQGATGVGILALVARRFYAGRGRLLSITQLGHPAGELIFPSARPSAPSPWCSSPLARTSRQAWRCSRGSASRARPWAGPFGRPAMKGCKGSRSASDSS